jgi:hypothetical protein
MENAPVRGWLSAAALDALLAAGPDLAQEERAACPESVGFGLDWRDNALSLAVAHQCGWLQGFQVSAFTAAFRPAAAAAAAASRGESNRWVVDAYARGVAAAAAAAASPAAYLVRVLRPVALQVYVHAIGFRGARRDVGAWRGKVWTPALAEARVNIYFYFILFCIIL